MKFYQNFGETFSVTFGKFWESFVTPPPHPFPPPKKCEKLYTLHCAKINFLPKL